MAPTSDPALVQMSGRRPSPGPEREDRPLVGWPRPHPGGTAARAARSGTRRATHFGHEHGHRPHPGRRPDHTARGGVGVVATLVGRQGHRPGRTGHGQVRSDPLRHPRPAGPGHGPRRPGGVGRRLVRQPGRPRVSRRGRTGTAVLPAPSGSGQCPAPRDPPPCRCLHGPHLQRLRLRRHRCALPPGAIGVRRSRPGPHGGLAASISCPPHSSWSWATRIRCSSCWPWSASTACVRSTGWRLGSWASWPGRPGPSGASCSSPPSARRRGTCAPPTGASVGPGSSPSSLRRPDCWPSSVGPVSPSGPSPSR